MNLISRFAAFFGIFVAHYHDNYVYVPSKPAKKGKLSPTKNSLIELPAKSLNTLDEDQFYAIADQVISDGRTFLAHDRLYIHWQAVRNVCSLGLPSAEVGSYRGGSAYFIASAFKCLLGEEIPLHIFDTFEGHPDKINKEYDNYQTQGSFWDTDYEEVRTYLSSFSKLEIHKGEFSNVVREFSDMHFGYVHIDVDIYQTTLDCLNYFGSRLAVGGIILIDDYRAPTCEGVERAANEYLKSVNGFQAWYPFTEQLVLIRTSA